MEIASILALITLGATLLNQLIPLIIPLIQGVEQTGLAGPEKKQTVLDSFNAMWAGVLATGQVSGEWAKIQPTQLTAAVSGLTDMMVAMFNVAGIFKKAAKAAPSA